MLRRPALFLPFPHLVAAESTRHGGVSKAPYRSLNLGKSTGDQPEHVAENRRRFCTALGFQPDQLTVSQQVHGVDIWPATAPGLVAGFDALITNQPGLLLAVSVADCTPILIFDAKNQAVAAVHAGWRGTVAGIVSKTLQALQEQYGTRALDCYAYVGTCIDAASFEVGAEVAAAFSTAFQRFDADKNKFFIDLKKANLAQLLDFGIPKAQLEVSPYSTVLHNDDYFSHRREQGVTGRMWGAIGMV